MYGLLGSHLENTPELLHRAETPGSSPPDSASCRGPGHSTAPPTPAPPAKAPAEAEVYSTLIPGQPRAPRALARQGLEQRDSAQRGRIGTRTGCKPCCRAAQGTATLCCEWGGGPCLSEPGVVRPERSGGSCPGDGCHQVTAHSGAAALQVCLGQSR